MIKYRIKEICTAKGLTLAELAAKTGIHAQSISRIVKTNNTRPSTLERIAKVLGVSTEELISNDDAESRDSRISVIKGIPVDRMGVAKIITIYAPTKNGVMDVGFVAYKRSFYPKYRFDENQKPKSFMDEYPIQSSYPHDELDTAILEAIKETYPESKLHNKLIAFNTDIEYLNWLIDRPSKPLEIIVNPHFTYEEMMSSAGKIFSQFNFKFNMYYDLDFDTIRSVFISNYDIGKKEELSKQLQTMTAF
ncbi:MAG: hypothetical protein EZS26_003851 [Candidatus Ordinivivax streblomastigis]|uniref:HTH cro/C1-type domain-containing protein n=1 Tax=Candidatus Ordinivivax streblomastigis TaxID=2540710 RepID=A0A5M8NSP4_9BACT|nr:MAG: hypothetical protein EZS26_003851 [Candidatus Ordinivivax streblomastigis]